MDSHRATSAARLNLLGLLGTSGVLLVAFTDQLVLGELPCPLCLLQRAGFVGIGIGFLLNLRCGASPAHYGVILISAIAGALVASRQVMLHIVPGSGAYGSALFGLHFYTWALIGFAAAVLFAALTLFVEKFGERTGAASTPWPRVAAWLFVLVVAANAVSTLLECGLGPCADNPTGYLWLE